MRPEELEVLSICIRNILITGTNFVTLFYFVLHILKMRKGIWALIVYYGVYFVLRNLLCAHVLPYYFADAEWVLVVQFWVPLIGNSLSWFVWYYVVDAEFLRLGIVSILSEMFATLINFGCLGVLNLLEQRPVWDVGQLMWPDFLFPFLQIGLTMLIWKLAKGWFLKLRTCRLPARGVLWVAFLGFNGLAIYSHTQLNVNNWAELALLSTGLNIVMFVLLVRLAIVRSKHTREEKAYLDAQKRVIETHYDVVQGQIQRMEEQQKLIDEQMKEIVQMDADVDSKTIQAYLAQLKKNYADIRAGIYCNDWVVDAVLYSQSKIYEELGIGFECFMQEYDRGSIEEQDILQIILTLLEFGRAGRRISLRMAGVKNQLMIYCEVEDVSDKKFPRKNLKSMLQKYQGKVEVETKERTVKSIIMLEKG